LRVRQSLDRFDLELALLWRILRRQSKRRANQSAPVVQAEPLRMLPTGIGPREHHVPIAGNLLGSIRQRLMRSPS
jgi:hypothetical protein